MNSRLFLVVQAAMFAFGLPLAGCIQVDGGAVELSWTVRRADRQEDVECARGTDIMKDVWLCARACTVIKDGACVGEETCPVRAFPCDRFHGSTKFEITAGRKELWIEVKCAGGATANVVVPEPILRDIADAEVTELNALLISVSGDRACPVQ